MKSKLLIRVSLVWALICLAVLALNPGWVFATSWVRLQPDEVINRAEVIVQGRYDFSEEKKRQPDNGMWVPFKFSVEKYYRDSGTTVIEAAIEQFDVEWVKQFQEQEGSFILFLERDENNPDLLIPVGGPNGMIQVQAGDFQNIEPAYAQQYEDFLASQTPIVPTEEPKPSIENSIVSKAWPWILALIILTLCGLLLGRMRQRKS